MPDPQTGQPYPWELPPGQVVRQGIDPFLYGPIGFGPLTYAGLEAFNTQQRPVLEQQAQLLGLGRSPAVMEITSDALSQVLPQFIMQDFENRFRAAGTLQGEEQLNQSAANLAAGIANQEQQRQLQAFQAGGDLLLGVGNLYNQSGQNQLNQMQLALQAADAGGGLQQDIAQQAMDAAQMERLRLQSLSENATTGLFSTVLPGPSQQGSTTRSSGGGK